MIVDSFKYLVLIWKIYVVLYHVKRIEITQKMCSVTLINNSVIDIIILHIEYH